MSGSVFESRQKCDTCGEDICFRVHDDAFGARYVTVTHGRPGQRTCLRRSEPIMRREPWLEVRVADAMTFLTHVVMQKTQCLEYHVLWGMTSWPSRVPSDQ